jgi:hypothetical protein
MLGMIGEILEIEKTIVGTKIATELEKLCLKYVKKKGDVLAKQKTKRMGTKIKAFMTKW